MASIKKTTKTTSQRVKIQTVTKCSNCGKFAKSTKKTTKKSGGKR